MTKQIFKSRRVITPEGEMAASVLVENGTIVDVGAYDAPFLDNEIVVHDFADLVLMPGIVDSHVHINEPGRTDWEGFDTATHAAAAGGITTVVDMPLNCIPVTISAADFQKKLDVIDGKLMIDTAFWGGATADNLSDLPALLDSGVLGVKSFTINSGIDEFKHVNEAQLLSAMRECAKRSMIHLVHAELELTDPKKDLSEDSSDNGDVTSYQRFLSSRPTTWENDAISMVISVMKTLKAEGLEPHAHIVHLSSAQALPIIRSAREQGLNLTVETCPHYLVLEAETIPNGQASYKCCPPIRGKDNQDQLWQALIDGTINCVVSDHSPCTPDLKNLDSGDVENAWGGISGLQFGLSLMWTNAQRRGISLRRLSELMSTNSARLVGLHSKGSIEIGKQADFCIFDPDGSFTVTADIIQHKNKVSPYIGRDLNGVVVSTWLAGEKILEQGKFVGEAKGLPILKRGPITARAAMANATTNNTATNKAGVELMTLDQLNGLDDIAAFKEFEACCVAVEWINAVVAARPFKSIEQLHSSADAIWSGLTPTDFLQAFEGHPRIGDVNTLRAKYTNTAHEASNEQSGMSVAQDEIINEMAKLNDEYFEKFGFIFIVCATGKSAEQMLVLLKNRLPNAVENEIEIAAQEQAKITRIRIDKLLAHSF